MMTRASTSRAQIKSQGAKIIADLRAGEVYDQVWQTPDGQHWSGYDWYNDTTAKVHPISDEDAADFIARARQAYINRGF
jgi:hypothetical protein